MAQTERGTGETRDCCLLHPKRTDSIQETKVSRDHSVGLQFQLRPLGVADGPSIDHGARLSDALKTPLAH